MALCQMCGSAVPAPGLTYPGPCGNCMPTPGTAAQIGPYRTALPSASMKPPVVVSMSEHVDSHLLITFKLSAGAVQRDTVWNHWERIPQEGSMIVNEVTATTVGGHGDANLVLDSSVVKLVDSDSSKVIFERPLGILTVLDARNRNVETEERLSRLERMMNVLVEQESPAGEALRRLGGAKIEYESPTRLAIAAHFSGGSTVGVTLTVHDALSLLNDVVVRVSIVGISKRPVL